jgi:hypothetical protein
LLSLRVLQIIESYDVPSARLVAGDYFMRVRADANGDPAKLQVSLQAVMKEVTEASSSWDPSAAGMTRCNVGSTIFVAFREASKPVRMIKELVAPLLDEARKLLTQSKQSLRLLHEAAADLAVELADDAGELEARKSLLATLIEEKHSDTGDCYDYLGLSFIRNGDYEAGMAALRNGLRDTITMYGATSVHVHSAQARLQWFERQAAAKPDVYGSKVCCTAEFVHGSGGMTLRRKEVNKHLKSTVVLGAAAQNNADCAKYKLRPLHSSVPHVLYYEVTMTNAKNDPEAPTNVVVGFASAAHILCVEVGLSSRSIGLATEMNEGDHLGVVYLRPDMVPLDYCGPVKSGDVIGCGMDTKASTVFWTLNGQRFRDVDVANVDSMPFAAVTFGDRTEANDLVTLNFGDTKFKYVPSSPAQIPARPALHPSSRLSQRCSWLLDFESAMEMRKCASFEGAHGVVVLEDDGAYKSRALPGSEGKVRYFEMTLLKVPDGPTKAYEGLEVSLGLVSRAHNTVSPPGWVEESVGFHCNGNLGVNGEELEMYGPAWSQGDVVGVGIDYLSRTVFFTHEGQRLKDILHDSITKLQLACVTLSDEATTERVKLNFGDTPFKYNHAAALALPSTTLNYRECPFAHHNSECSWVVTFDSPTSVRRTPQRGTKDEDDESISYERGSVRLNGEDRYKYRKLAFGGSGSSSSSVSASSPPSTTSVHFAEFTVLELGASDMTIGLADYVLTPQVEPGDAESDGVGWRADGLLFIEGVQYHYGPCWSEGDVVGVCLDTDKHVAFFMLNGRKLRDINLTPEANDVDGIALAFGSQATSERLEINMGWKDAPAPGVALASAFKFPPTAAQRVALVPIPTQDDLEDTINNDDGKALIAEQMKVYMRGLHRHCSWVVDCDAPLSLRRVPQKPTKDEEGDDTFIAGSILLSDPSFALRLIDDDKFPGLVYFEITIKLNQSAQAAAKKAKTTKKKKGEEDDSGGAVIDVWLGFAGAEVAVVDCSPGDMAGSIGFSSLSGAVCYFDPEGDGEEVTLLEEYGPAWADGDVIGCALDLENKIVFYTHNGKKLGELPAPVVPVPEKEEGEEEEEEEEEEEVSAELFACVGFGASCVGAEIVHLNLGDTPFKYVHKPAPSKAKKTTAAANKAAAAAAAATKGTGGKSATATKAKAKEAVPAAAAGGAKGKKSADAAAAAAGTPSAGKGGKVKGEGAKKK